MIDKIFFKIAQAAESTPFNNLHVPAGEGTSTTLISVIDTITSIITILMEIIGFLAALYFLYGALLYIISYGNDSKATKAKQTMIWALIGLAVAILARLLVYLVQSSLTTK
jgi:hypothetical protein